MCVRLLSSEQTYLKQAKRTAYIHTLLIQTYTHRVSDSLRAHIDRHLSHTASFPSSSFLQPFGICLRFGRSNPPLEIKKTHSNIIMHCSCIMFKKIVTYLFFFFFMQRPKYKYNVSSLSFSSAISFSSSFSTIYCCRKNYFIF